MDVFEALAENLNKDNYITKAKRIRNNLVSIESILNNGTPVMYLVTKLNEYGFEIKFSVFQTELYRARKLAKKQSENPVTENKVNTVTADKQINTNIGNGGNSQETEKPDKAEVPPNQKVKSYKVLNAETEQEIADSLKKPSAYDLKLMEKLEAKEAKKKKNEQNNT
jgi:hypothetical protein